MGNRDKVRNKDPLAKIGIVPIKEKMWENYLRWFDHVQCKPIDTPVCPIGLLTCLC